MVRNGLAPACTRGLFRPRVELDAALAEQLSDAELTGALLHELEHVSARDPLRFFVAQVALSLNPLGWLLAGELARCHLAREALCDRRAVEHGADPLALARSIVWAARPAAPAPLTASLGGHGLAGVQLRVQLLLDYATRAPLPAERAGAAGPVTVLVATLAVLPHLIGTAPLDALHRGIERAALLLGMG